MNDKKRKLVIFLADLTHTGGGISTNKMPLGIGLLASYALKRFGSDIQIKLFKYPDKLLHALQHEEFDVVGCTTFNWNNNLSEWACKTAKTYNPDVITIRGGYNFPLDVKQQESYMQNHRFTDIYCLFEGEIAFCNFIERLLSIDGDIKKWNREPLEGCVFLSQQTDELIVGNPLPRLKTLDEIPSPYTSGLFDHFFDGKLTPMIETSRGCPFSCDFCNSSNEYYNKMAFFSEDYVKEEVNYIAKKIVETGVVDLIICDLNFGMYARDKHVSDAIKGTMDEYGWPVTIQMSTGKNAVDRIVATTAQLASTFVFDQAVQSMNEETLQNIKRSNIKVDAYKQLTAKLEEHGIRGSGTYIVPLPGETYASYMRGVEQLIEAGAKAVTTHTLQLNYGTVYKNEAYRKQWGYDRNSAYRLIPNDFGIYGSDKVFDVEEVAFASNSLDFDEYLKIREFVLMTEALYNSEIFKEVFKCVEEMGISNFQFLKYAFDNLQYAPEDVRAVFKSCVSDSQKEIMATEAELTEFLSKEVNYEGLKTGEIAGNVLYKHKSMLWGYHLTSWIDYIFRMAADIISIKSVDRTVDQGKTSIKTLNSVVSFMTNKLQGIFEAEQTPVDITVDFEYDILGWSRAKNGKTLNDYKRTNKSLTYRFYYDESQRTERDDLFRRYGSDSLGLSKIQAKVPMDRLVRKVENL